MFFKRNNADDRNEGSDHNEKNFMKNIEKNGGFGLSLFQLS